MKFLCSHTTLHQAGIVQPSYTHWVLFIFFFPNPPAVLNSWWGPFERNGFTKLYDRLFIKKYNVRYTPFSFIHKELLRPACPAMNKRSLIIRKGNYLLILTNMIAFWAVHAQGHFLKNSPIHWIHLCLPQNITLVFQSQ